MFEPLWPLLVVVLVTGAIAGAAPVMLAGMFL